MIFFKTPKFWQNKDSKISKALSPVAKIYTIFNSIKKNKVVTEKLPVPVICVSGMVFSGSGKTLTTDAVFQILKKSEYNTHIISSSRGGYLKNVVMVNPSMHSYLQVGDDSLMLSSFATTWIGKNRVNAGRAAIASKANAIIMDDQQQNEFLEKDLQILIVDSEQGLGNERVFPAGPLRESLELCLKKADCVLIIGNTNLYLENKIKTLYPKLDIFYASIQVSNSVLPSKSKIIGFCGLGYPEKFHKTLKELDFDIVDFISFSDHHPYTITEIQKLINAAKSTNSQLVTTRKDFIKIPDVFKKDVLVIDIELLFPNKNFEDLLLNKISHNSNPE